MRESLGTLSPHVLDVDYKLWDNSVIVVCYAMRVDVIGHRGASRDRRIEELQVVDINAARGKEKNRNVDWATNVVRGYASGKTTHSVDKDGRSTIRVYLLDAGLAVSEIEIW